jgi:dihydropyrimidinase/allantoinase
MVVDIVLENGKIMTPGGIFEGGLAIESGKIVAMAKNSTLPQAEKSIDLEHRFVLPGFIDAHSHIRGMGRSEWEDFTTGTMAAAAGGVTTILEMPITLPPTSTRRALKEKRDTMARQAVVNFAIYGAAGSQNIEEIPVMAEEGVIAFKTFMHPPPPGRESDFWGLYVTDDGSFLDVMRAIAQTGLISCVHAENPEIVDYLTRKLQSQGRRDLLAYLESRPGITESEAISRAAILASEAQVHLHICHVCAKEAVKIVRNLKREGRFLTSETCPHYLTFTFDEIKNLGPYAKINPPIRYDADRRTLWQALNEGVIDLVASDHASYPKQVKEIGREDIWKAYMGTASLQVMGPVMLTHVSKGLITLEKLTKVLSENVAKIFNLYPRKGVLTTGADADLIVVDMKKKKKLKSEEFYTKAKDMPSIYDDFEVLGMPVLTMVNGVEVMKDGEVLGEPGTGRFVTGSLTVPTGERQQLS